MGGEQPPAVAHAFEKRLQALEDARVAERAPWQSDQANRGKGSLFQLLTRDPALGDTLVKGWNRKQVTEELGWPDRIEGQDWFYESPDDEGPALRLTFDQRPLVVAIVVLNPRSDR